MTIHTATNDEGKRFCAAVYGATGFLGAELLRRLLGHPEVHLRRVHAADHLGLPLGAAQPHLEGISDLRYEPVPDDESAVAPVDVVFLALPHAVSWAVTQRLIGTGTRIIDCSGAFRLRDPGLYQKFYGQTHPMTDLLPQFVYGQTEFNHARLVGARYVASPGCFATAIELGLMPLARAGVLEGDVQVVAMTGSSGAGSAALPTTHHPVRAGNIRCYRPFTHQHEPEIVETLTAAGGRRLHLNFVPIAAPLVRGILATSFAKVPAEVTQAQLDQWVDSAFDGCRFVRRPQKRHPEVVAITGSNSVEVALIAGPEHDGQRTVSAVSALDNLVKGGAGQAIQNMNLMLGLDEALGLADPGAYP